MACGRDIRRLLVFKSALMPASRTDRLKQIKAKRHVSRLHYRVNADSWSSSSTPSPCATRLTKFM